jgi:hypothetical protein
MSNRSLVLVVAMGGALLLTGVKATSANTLEPSSLRALDDALPAAPLAVTFDKVTDGEGGPYVLKLKNTSSDSITVSAKIFPSVTIHTDTKERNLPERALAAGDVWSIPGLAATDKVTVNAKGFAPLEIVVP